MSGTKDDILELIGEHERPKVSKLISLMGSHRPRIEIDRVFQRKLKNTLIEKTKKTSFSWYPWLSPFGVVATSFFVIFGIWRIWGGQGGLSREIPPPDEQSIAMLQSDVSQITSSDMSNASLVGASEVSDLGSSIQKENISERTITKNGEKSKTNDTLVKENISSNIDIASDIAQVRSDIDTIASTMSTSLPASSTTMKMMDSIVLVPLSTLSLPSYSKNLLIYTKATPWTDSEVRSRYASGMTSIRVETLPREMIRSRLENLSLTGDIRLIYVRATREGKSEYTIVPALSYEGGQIPLIEGYTLK